MTLYLFCVVSVVAVRAQLLIGHGTCSNRCFLANDYTYPCQCSFDCETYGNCCNDFWIRCRGSEYGLIVTQKELNDFAQSLWDNDVNRIPNALYSLNYQTQTTSHGHGDPSHQRLIIPSTGQLDAILANPNKTYHSFIKLLNNYSPARGHVEHHPIHELQEEVAFWNAISKTKIIQLAFRFLVDQGYLKGDIHAMHTVINEMWFELYPTSNHSKIKTDSGFEHIMVGELSHYVSNHTRHNVVTGFNNWVRFYEEEKAGRLNYNGYLKYAQNPNLVDVRFTWRNATAQARSFFVGTSPEFDLALYTVCAVIHPNKPCSVQINGHHINIRTTSRRHRYLQQLTSAMPGFQAAPSGT